VLDKATERECSPVVIRLRRSCTYHVEDQRHKHGIRVRGDLGLRSSGCSLLGLGAAGRLFVGLEAIDEGDDLLERRRWDVLEAQPKVLLGYRRLELVLVHENKVDQLRLLSGIAKRLYSTRRE